MFDQCQVEITSTAHVVHLPWAAWYRDTQQHILFPKSFTVELLLPRGASPLFPDQIDACLDRPVNAPLIQQFANSDDKVCLVVDDLARPTRAALVLPSILERLHAAGISRSNIRVLVATGTHSPLDERQMCWKLGEDVVRDYQVECHSAETSVVETDIDYGNARLQINPTFLNADLKIGITSVLPHSFAGYSGGAKIMLPGLADVPATARSHKFVQMGLRGGNNPNENAFRLETERLARQLGMKVTVCVVPNHQRAIASVVYGDLVDAHREACKKAASVYETPVEKTYDCLVLNAYPKDIDLVQAENVFVALKSLARPLLRENGVYLITTAASEGIGHHGLFSPGGVRYRLPRKNRKLGERNLWIFSPNLSPDSVHQMYWEGYSSFDSPQSLFDALLARFSGEPSVGILPYAPMQQVIDHRESGT